MTAKRAALVKKMAVVVLLAATAIAVIRNPMVVYYVFLDPPAAAELWRSRVPFIEGGTCLSPEKKVVAAVNGFGLGKRTLFRIDDEAKEISAANLSQNDMLAIAVANKEPTAGDLLLVFEERSGELKSTNREIYATCHVPLAWSMDGKYLAVFEIRGMQGTESTQQRVSILDSTNNFEQIGFQETVVVPSDLRWITERTLAIPVSSFKEVSVTCFDVEHNTKKKFVRIEGEWKSAGSSEEVCEFQEVQRALYGHPKSNSMASLITWSPSRRFYFSLHKPDSKFIQREWIEANDTKTGKSWKIYTTFPWWRTFTTTAL